jgi:hypothetical protein
MKRRMSRKIFAENRPLPIRSKIERGHTVTATPKKGGYEPLKLLYIGAMRDVKNFYS